MAGKKRDKGVARSGLQNRFPLGVRWDIAEVALTRTRDEFCACLDEKGKKLQADH